MIPVDVIALLVAVVIASASSLSAYDRSSGDKSLVLIEQQS